MRGEKAFKEERDYDVKSYKFIKIHPNRYKKYVFLE